MGKSSGLESVADWLGKMGVDASQGQREAIVQKVKEASTKKKGLLSDNEVKKIVESIIHG